MWGRRLRQLLNISLLALYIVVAYHYIEARVGCLVSKEWKTHIVDMNAALLPEELERPWDSEFTFIPPLTPSDPPNAPDNGQIPLDKIERPLETARIPRILHQTYKTKEIPTKWSRPYEMCQNALANYTYMLWTDESARDFIQTHYRWFIPTFDSYPYPIQRADAIRYFVLYHYGGFYVDLDIGCRRSFEPLRDPRYHLILPKTDPVGVSNDWMASRPRHPFFGSVIFKLREWNTNLLTNYPTIFFSTGPMFLNIMYCQFDDKKEIAILPDMLYGGSWKSSFTGHFPGSSWHSWDAAIVFFVWKNWLSLLMGVLLMFGLFWLGRWIRRRQLRGYESVNDETKEV